MWGFNLSVAGLQPCSWNPGVKPELQFPVTCACLLQCDSETTAARNDCVQELPVLPATDRSAGFDLSEHQPPWRGSPKSLRWPELGATFDPTLAARLHKDASASRVEGRCGGRGIWTKRLWDFNDRRAATAELACICLPGHSGPDCAPSPSTIERCMNRCSGAGRCVLGTCVCDEPHVGGIDCSQPLAPPPHGHAHGGLGSSASAPPRAVASSAHTPPSMSAVRPRIYVYDLPARLVSWLALPTLGASASTCTKPLSSFACWWAGGIDPAYAADVAVLRRVLRSPHRTTDPREADFFLVPLLLSLGFRSLRFGQYMPSGGAAQLINRTVTHIQRAHPWWNASGGADHLLTITGDLGSTWLRARLPVLERAIFLQHWGYSCVGGLVTPPYGCVRNLGFRSHHSGQDIVIPPLQRPAQLLPASPWMQHAASDAPTGGSSSSSASSSAAAALPFGGVLERGRRFEYLLYFVGKVHRGPNEDHSYSHGVRQRLFALHANRTDFYLRDRPGATALELATVRASKFCLAPHGVGFGMRQFNAIAAGCVPLIIDVTPDDDREFGGTLEQAYEEVVPWSRFVLRVNRSQLPDLPRVLREVPAARHEAMQRAAACAWPRLFWLHAFGGDTHDPQLEPPPPNCNAECLRRLADLVRVDAFDTLMMNLRRRVQARNNASGPSSADGYAREWLTPAASCLKALEIEKSIGLETTKRLAE